MVALTIGEHHFKSQGQCRKYVQDLLKSVGVTKSVKNADCNSFTFLTLLCQRHPNKDTKLNNFNDFVIERNAMNRKAYALFVMDCNGNKQDISWIQCISGKPKSHKQELTSALRNAIQYQIDDFKKTIVNRRMCQNCRCSIQDIPHIHHAGIEFEDIAQQFLLSIDNLNVPQEFDDEKKTNVRVFKPQDRLFMEQWQVFHQEHAHLQNVCQKCNLSTLKVKSN